MYTELYVMWRTQAVEGLTKSEVEWSAVSDVDIQNVFVTSENTKSVRTSAGL
jgi:hypothetical protein